MFERLRHILRRFDDRTEHTCSTARSDVIDEHYVPSRGLALGEYIAACDVCGTHHLAKYTWASMVLAECRGISRVLDVACGSGYGAYMLARAMPDCNIVGADYDPEAIRAAVSAYSSPNLRFQIGDVTRWEETIGDGLFDCIVSFDTIEHVSHRDIMLRHLVEHLSPDGMLLFSTPCGASWDNLCPKWPAHKIEYSTASLYDVLSRYFGTILRPDDGSLPHREVFDAVNASGIEYLLRLNPVICRDPIVIANPYAPRKHPLTPVSKGLANAQRRGTEQEGF